MQFPVTFDWTINAGHMFTVFALGWVFVKTYFGMKADLKIVQTELKSVQEHQKALSEAFTQLGTILTQVAVQDNRLNMVEKNLDELRHGHGFIQLPHS